MNDSDQSNPPSPEFKSKKGERPPAGPSGRRAVRDALPGALVEPAAGPGRKQKRRGLVRYASERDAKKSQLNLNKAKRAKVKVRGRGEKAQAVEVVEGGGSK